VVFFLFSLSEIYATINTVDNINANPIASKKEKGFPKKTTEHIVATTGSIQAIILAFVGPIIPTPDR
jgi:hypothetical protein